MIESIDRALAILQLFLQEEAPLSLTQISKKMGMHKSTVSRTLDTLEGRDFAMELRGALLREVVQGALLHPVRLVEHAEQRGQVELPRVDATVEGGRAHYGRFWYSKSE